MLQHAEFSADTPERILGEDGGWAYRNFVDWTVGGGFALAIVEIAAPRRQRELLAWTASQVPNTRVVEMDRASGKPLRPVLDAAFAPPGAPALWVLTRLDEAKDRAKLYARLNIQRDELVRDYPVPWVIMIHPAAAMEFSMRAPDLAHFAGLWLREEAEPEARMPDALGSSAPTAMETHTAPTMGVAEGSDLLRQANDALVFGRLDEAADLLAQADFRNPKGRTEDGWRLYLGGWLSWMRGDPPDALAQLDAAREIFERLGDARGRAVTLGKVADILAARGELDEALRLRREEQLPVYERLGDVRSRAVTLGQVANILQARGELDEALRILREEVLPVFERVGDIRSRAVTLGQVAEILQARGELDEALRIRREEQLPVFERLGDVRSRAITLGNIAGILQARGELDEALRIRREEQLPVFERLGDVRERAVTLGQVANILADRGELDEAIRIYCADVLPIFERLGDVRSLLVDRANLAQMLLKRGDPADIPEARRLLALALHDARRLRIPEAGQIEKFIRAIGGDPVHG